MPTALPRIQVTVDADLAAALDQIDTRGVSRSRLIRDLALRGARAEAQERDRRRASIETLLRIADGETDHDLDAVHAMHAARERSV